MVQISVLTLLMSNLWFMHLFCISCHDHISAAQAGCSVAHLGEQERDGGECKGPAVLVGEKGLTALSPVQHFIVYTGDVQHQTHHQSQTWETNKLRLGSIQEEERTETWWERREHQWTWEDEEDPGYKRQHGAVRPDVADVVEDEADEHEEEADQGERSGGADHLWGGDTRWRLNPKPMGEHFRVKNDGKRQRNLRV